MPVGPRFASRVSPPPCETNFRLGAGLPLATPSLSVDSSADVVPARSACMHNIEHVGSQGTAGLDTNLKLSFARGCCPPTPSTAASESPPGPIRACSVRPRGIRTCGVSGEWRNRHQSEVKFRTGVLSFNPIDARERESRRRAQPALPVSGHARAEQLLLLFLVAEPDRCPVRGGRPGQRSRPQSYARRWQTTFSWWRASVPASQGSQESARTLNLEGEGHEG